ncbi:MAG: hypothetical protein GF355_09355, partial [Candidatus Eisenbacteria bacterium]|nr:hypothetical protein [Candidatus Eisenbacteria bacterium]
MDAWRRPSHSHQASRLRRRAFWSHVLPVAFLGLANLLLGQAGWRVGAQTLTPGTLLLDLGLLLLALAMAWGFALSHAGWITGAVSRLEQLASTVPGRTPKFDWEPVDWELDHLAHRMRSLISQNRRGVEALAEVEAVRNQATALLKGWGGAVVQDQPGPNDSPAKFWRKVRRVLVDRMNDVSRRAAALAERSAACSHQGSELAQRISATTIQTESLYLEATRKAVRRTRSTDALSENLVAEVRQGLDHWSAVARRALA